MPRYQTRHERIAEDGWTAHARVSAENTRLKMAIETLQLEVKELKRQLAESEGAE